MQIIKKSDALLGYIHEALADCGFPPDSEKVEVARTLLDLTHYHAWGISTLVKEGIFPPAFALLRVEYEAFLRGIWLLKIATPAQSEKFIKNEKIKHSTGCLASLVEHELGAPDTISKFHDIYWGALNSYTHGGKLQFDGHRSGNAITPKFSDEQIEELMTWSSRFDAISFAYLLDLTDCSKKEEKLQKLEELGNGWCN